MVDTFTLPPSVQDPSTAEHWTLALLLLLESPRYSETGVARAHAFIASPDLYGFTDSAPTYPAREPFVRWAITGVGAPERLREGEFFECFLAADLASDTVRRKRDLCLALAETASLLPTGSDSVRNRRALVLYLVMAAVFSPCHEALAHLNRAMEIDPAATVADPLSEIVIARLAV